MKKNQADIKEILYKYSKQLKISDVGVCEARVYDELEEVLSKYDTPFVPPVKKRISAFDFVDGARSVIMCVFNYYRDGDDAGNLSRYVWGEDYHGVIKKKLADLCALLENEIGSFSHYIFCDDSPLCDKYLAYLSGLGVIGENHLLIHPKFGSYVFIGGIVTDIDLEYDVPLMGNCEKCGKCRQSCPGGVFDNGFEARKCASYIMQKKGELSKNEIEIMQSAGKVWGCDICSKVCPHNANPINTDIEEFYAESFNIDEKSLESDAQFKERFSKRAFAWRGTDIIKRNLSFMHKK